MGIGDRGWCVGDLTAGVASALLPSRRVLAVIHSVGAALQIVRHAHAHLASGADHGDGQLAVGFCAVGHACLLLR